MLKIVLLSVFFFAKTSVTNWREAGRKNSFWRLRGAAKKTFSRLLVLGPFLCSDAYPALFHNTIKSHCKLFPTFKTGVGKLIQSLHTIFKVFKWYCKIAEHMCLDTYILRVLHFLFYCQTVFWKQLFSNNSAILFLKSPPKGTAKIYFGGYSILLSQLRQ